MCGGQGKRLGSMTKNIPKPLVKINDKTIYLDLKDVNNWKIPDNIFVKPDHFLAGVQL